MRLCCQMRKIHMVKISDIIAKTYQPVELRNSHTKIIDVGGRGCTKSSKNAIIICFLMSMYPNCDTLVLRNNFEQHRNTTYAELSRALDSLGLVENVHFTLKKNPLEIKFVNGNTIYFKQGKEHEKLKGFAPSNKNNFIGIVWFFEVSEFESSFKLEQCISSGVRGEKPFFYEIYETNPPADRFHWLFDWIEIQKKDKKTIYNFRTYLDLTEFEQKYWLGVPFLNTINALKNSNIELYNHIYLGMPRKLENSVYKKMPEVKKRPKKFDYILCGLDYGEVDATTVVCVGVEKRTNSYYIFDQYYKKGGVGMVINDYISEVCSFVNNINKVENTKMYFYIETAPSSVYNLFANRTGIDKTVSIFKAVKSGVYSKNIIQERIDTTNFLIGSNQLFITDEKFPIYKAFAQAEYKNGKRLDNKNFDIDSLDAFEYAIQSEIKYIMRGVTTSVTNEAE